jgi:hypothetical protein
VIIKPRSSWDHCSIPTIVTSSPATKRESLKISSSVHQTHHSLSLITCVNSSMDTIERCFTPDRVLDHVHIWFQVTQSPLSGALPHERPRQLQTTGHLPQLILLKLEDFQMFPASEHNGGQDHVSVYEDSGQWLEWVGVWLLPYIWRTGIYPKPGNKPLKWTGTLVIQVFWSFMYIASLGLPTLWSPCNFIPARLY